MKQYECTLARDDDLPQCDRKIAAFVKYWRGIRPPDAVLPGRQHFDPAEIPQLLPLLRLYDVHRDPWRFRYRLIGTELVRVVGRDLTGTWFHDGIANAEETSSFHNLVFVAEGKGLCYRCGFPLLHSRNKDHLSAERILLPLARNGNDVDIVLGLTVFHPVNIEAPPRPVAVKV
jgi:hypothetical protein